MKENVKMTKKEALEVKGLAKDTVEALGVITERECPECSSCGLSDSINTERWWMNWNVSPAPVLAR